MHRKQGGTQADPRQRPRTPDKISSGRGPLEALTLAPVAMMSFPNLMLSPLSVFKVLPARSADTTLVFSRTSMPGEGAGRHTRDGRREQVHDKCHCQTLGWMMTGDRQTPRWCSAGERCLGREPEGTRGTERESQDMAHAPVKCLVGQ